MEFTSGVGMPSKVDSSAPTATMKELVVDSGPEQESISTQPFTGAAVWDLQPTSSTPPAPESLVVMNLCNPDSKYESIVNPSDGRVKVDPEHFATYGKYRAIVKVFSHYVNQDAGTWTMGTGWLIAPDVFVTAGHCAYDKGFAQGRAVEVKSYIGYDGHESETSPKVQFRRVKRIVTTEGFIQSHSPKPYDVSFMLVEKPFSDVKPIVPTETPASGILELGVVGYPGDKVDPITKENGASMYEMYHMTNFSLASQRDHMLEYLIDTYGGNSGAPVLVKSEGQEQVSIGAHVYGGQLNSASVIGRYGNNYELLVQQLRKSGPVNYNITFVKLAANKVPNSAPSLTTVASAKPPGPGWRGTGMKDVSASIESYGSNDRQTDSEESFMDILGAVSTGLSTFGGPYGALAGIAIGTVGQLVSKLTGPESYMDKPTLQQGSTERAVLAEATLSALESGGLRKDVQESIISDVKATVAKSLPTLRKAVPHIMGAMLEPALKIALQGLQDYNRQHQHGQEGFYGTLPTADLPVIEYTTAIDSSGDRNMESFIARLNESIGRELEESNSTSDSDTQESFFDIVKAGARLGLPVAKAGLSLLVDYLQRSGSAEAFSDDTISTPDGQHYTAFLLAKRALVADAALQAVMARPAEQFEEGFFTGIADTLKKIAPIILKAAPAVIKAVNPLVGKVVSGLLQQESSMVRKPRRIPSQQTVRPRVSMVTLNQNGFHDLKAS